MYQSYTLCKFCMVNCGSSSKYECVGKTRLTAENFSQKRPYISILSLISKRGIKSYKQFGAVFCELGYFCQILILIVNP